MFPTWPKIYLPKSVLVRFRLAVGRGSRSPPHPSAFRGEGGDRGPLGIKCGGPAPRAKQLVRPRSAEALILSARQMPASIQLLDLLNRQLLGFQGELMGIDGTRPQRAAGGKGRDP